MATEVMKDRFSREFRLTDERKSHILKHPEMKGQLEKIKETLADPDFIQRSKNDHNTLLFYKLYKKTPVGEKHLVAAAKLLNYQSFIITAFFTDNVRKGKSIWLKI